MNFSELNLDDEILKAISYMGFETATPIQESGPIDSGFAAPSDWSGIEMISARTPCRMKTVKSEVIQKVAGLFARIDW